MCVLAIDTFQIGVMAQDNPVGYIPPVGPRPQFIVTYNQYESDQPASFSYSNLGPKWTFNWLAYISDNPSSPSANVSYYTDGGGAIPITGFNPATQSFAPEVMSGGILTRTSPNSYKLQFLDGTTYVFAQPTATNGSSRNVFMTQVIDPQGNALQIAYDGNFRVVAVTDAIGQVTTLAYGDTNDIFKITQVTDPFGRFATFSYNARVPSHTLRVLIPVSELFAGWNSPSRTGKRNGPNIPSRPPLASQLPIHRSSFPPA